MADAQIIRVADAAVSALAPAWDLSGTPRSGSDAVSRVYEVPLSDPEYLDAFAGRQVWVFPAEYGRAAINRAIDNRRPKLAVVIAERYADPAPVPTSWLDARLAFVEQVVFETLANPRQPAFYAGLTPEDEGSTVVPYDVELLVTQRLFLSLVTVQYRLLYP